MELHSRGYKSELIFTSFDGQVLDCGEYLAVHTLANPNFFWGNLLIYDRPPRKGDAEKWIQEFRREFTDSRIYHMTFGWQSAPGVDPVGDAWEFESRGFRLEAKAVLTATLVRPPPKFNEDLVVRPLEGAHEWSAMVDLQTASEDYNHLTESQWRSFHETQSLRYQKMSAAGLGNWYGGFLDGKLVAGLGIYHRDGLGRFQIVSTHPEYRRRGICGTLVYLTARDAFENCGVRELVMCADPEYFAIRIYESVGFNLNVTEYGVNWFDANHT